METRELETPAPGASVSAGRVKRVFFSLVSRPRGCIETKRGDYTVTKRRYCTQQGMDDSPLTMVYTCAALPSVQVLSIVHHANSVSRDYEIELITPMGLRASATKTKAEIPFVGSHLIASSNKVDSAMPIPRH